MEDVLESMNMLKGLFASQQLAVLATQDEGQPYSNLVAFAHTDNLKYLVFVTARNTRKYSNLSADRKVAVLIDSRTNQISDFQTALAITALGTSEEATGSEKNRLAKVYLSKHPYLKDFVNKTSNALMKITISDYIVASFNKVQSLHIGDLGPFF